MAAEGLEVERNNEKLAGGRDSDALSTAQDQNAPKPRDKSGKFQKGAKEPAAEAVAGEPTETQIETAADATPSAETIDRIQKLVNDGKIPEALRAIGLDVDGLNGKQWEAMRKETSKAQAKLEARKTEINQRYQQVEQWAGQLEQRYQRYAVAEQALAAGDLEGFARAHGTSFDELNRKAIQQLSTKDPRVAELEARLNREAQQRQELEQKQHQAVAWQRNVQVTQQNLAALKDPRVSAAMAEDPQFPAAVTAHILQRNDPELTFEEAARDILNAVAAQYQRMQKIFGGAQAAPTVGSGQSASREEPSRRVSPVKPKTSLSSRGAAEAHAETPLRGQALLDKYTRIAAAKRATEMAELTDD